MAVVSEGCETIYRDYRWRELPALIHRTLRTVAMVMTLIACASSVGYVMALTQMPGKITAFFLTISSDKNVILFLISRIELIDRNEMNSRRLTGSPPQAGAPSHYHTVAR